MRPVIKKILSRIELIREYAKFKKIKMPFRAFHELKKNVRNQGESSLFGRSIKITDPFWYLHGLEEIFIEEVYNFDCDRKNPVIIDCGSNIGLSLIYFKRIHPDAQIFAFEPDSDIFKILQHNLSQFAIDDIKVFEKAVWINENPLLFKKNGSVGGHLIDKVGEDTVKIKTVRLKDFLDRRVDFLKIDIEGAEFDIIKDCEENLTNVNNIFIEYHSFHESPQMIGELLTILRKAGFKIYIKEAWENMKMPFIEKKGPYFDMQLNIFGYRRV